MSRGTAFAKKSFNRVLGSALPFLVSLLLTACSGGAGWESQPALVRELNLVHYDRATDEIVLYLEVALVNDCETVRSRDSARVIAVPGVESSHFEVEIVSFTRQDPDCRELEEPLVTSASLRVGVAGIADGVYDVEVSGKGEPLSDFVTIARFH